MSKVRILTTGGFGDCCQALQAAYFVGLNIGRENVDIQVFGRDEIWEPFSYYFGNQFNLSRGPEISENFLLASYRDFYQFKNKHTEYEDLFCVWPDLQFSFFDYKKYNCHPQIIKNKRLLEPYWKPERIVYIGLVTSTEGYLYYDIPNLINDLAYHLKDHTIYFPKINQWSGKKLELGDFNKRFPNNVYIDDNPSFIDSIKWMYKSCYGVYTDNGSSHLAYQLGQPRLILNPRHEQLPFVSRWQEDTYESIPIHTSVKEVLPIIYHNIREPRSCLIPRGYVLDSIREGQFRHNDPNWKDILWMKY